MSVIYRQWRCQQVLFEQTFSATVHMPFPLDKNDVSIGFIEKHFRKRGFVWTEDYFLSVLHAPQSKYDVYWSAIGLRKVGTERSIPVLRAFLTYPMQDVKCVSILTIAHIGRERVTSLLADALLSREYREKDYAMWAILDAADERAIPAVLEYFAKNRSKLRAGKLNAFGFGLRYLAKFRRTVPAIEAFINDIPSYWNSLPSREREELQKHLPELVQRIASPSGL